MHRPTRGCQLWSSFVFFKCRSKFSLFWGYFSKFCTVIWLVFQVLLRQFREFQYYEIVFFFFYQTQLPAPAPPSRCSSLKADVNHRLTTFCTPSGFSWKSPILSLLEVLKFRWKYQESRTKFLDFLSNFGKAKWKSMAIELKKPRWKLSPARFTFSQNWLVNFKIF